MEQGLLFKEWAEKGFQVSELKNGEEPFYNLLHQDLFGLYIVGGSRYAEDMNGIAERVWNRMISLRTMGEVE